MIETNPTSSNIEIVAYDKQMAFIQSQEYKSAFVAGLFAGKSYAGALKALVYCLAHPGSWGIVTAPQNRVLEIATIPTFEKVFPFELIAKKRMRPHPEWTLINGCRIFFWSTDKPETISGAGLAWADMDEGSLSPHLAFINIKKRLRQRDANNQLYPPQIWITTTAKQLNWLYFECTKKEDPMQFFTACSRENTFVPKEDMEKYIANLGLTGRDYEQEVEGKFVQISGQCLVDKDTIDLQLVNCIEPIEVRESGIVQIWRNPVMGVNYMAGADCADEGGCGKSCMIIADSQTGEQMAEVHGDISADDFSRVCYDLLKDYRFPIFAPERNGTVGGIVVTKMQAMGYPNLYEDAKERPGWYTKGTAYPPEVSRFTMLKELEEALRLRRIIVHNSDDIGELSTFANENGKYQARSGFSDDRVMAWAITWQMNKNARSRVALPFMSIKRLASTYA